MVVGLNTVNIANTVRVEPSFRRAHLILLGHLRRKAAVRLWTTADTSLLSRGMACLVDRDLQPGLDISQARGLAVTAYSVLPNAVRTIVSLSTLVGPDRQKTWES